MAGSGSEAKVYGLYLMDREQHVDNQVYVDHQVPETLSYEQFKGIIDENASAVFNGHIHVCPDAQKTEAYQSNKNILLTDTARVTTKPFLEIYADDVKCSHGATVGQLDPEAMFYLKSRGICDRNAKMLLMYAFAGEIANKINIEVLRNRIDAMIVKRLKGELSICDQCVLHCKENEMINFKIDMSKI
ncbi:MAG TPA: SufD family Fe-S cluster assembly protein [Bacteroidales bacterium]|nr:SufD family Fe-S cluster assembly protein [Bacteroidales bacterium]